MTIHGITISSHSGIWIWLGMLAAWLILCTFFWCLTTAAGNADTISGRK